MKETFFTLLFASCLLISCGQSRNNSAQNIDGSDSATAVIAFKEYEHNFGVVKEGRKLRHTFTFENTGEGNLVVQSVRASCGCTVPKYDRRPIASGKGGKIEVEFDTSGRNGMQTQIITVTSNATVPVIILRITAEVSRTI